MWIQSKVIPGARWEISHEILRKDDGTRALKHGAEIVAAEYDFIANYDPVVYCNDLTGAEWCFDTKLPTGGWLENIKPNWAKDGTRIFKATIMC